MERNKYPFIHFLRVIFILLAIGCSAASLSLIFLSIVALGSGNGAGIALGLGVGFTALWVIPLSLFAAFLNMFLASVLKLFVDIQDNTWETANQMSIFIDSSKQQTPKRKPSKLTDNPIQSFFD